MFKKSLITIATQTVIYSSLAIPSTVFAAEEIKQNEATLERITVTSQKRLQFI